MLIFKALLALSANLHPKPLMNSERAEEPIVTPTATHIFFCATLEFGAIFVDAVELES